MKENREEDDRCVLTCFPWFLCFFFFYKFFSLFLEGEVYLFLSNNFLLKYKRQFGIFINTVKGMVDMYYIGEDLYISLYISEILADIMCFIISFFFFLFDGLFEKPKCNKDLREKDI